MSDGELPRRVVIVGANYSPEESGNAPYTTGLAEDLAAQGVDVTVLCAMPHYPQWRIRDGYRGRLRVREDRAGVHIVRSWLWVPSRQSAFQRALFEGSFLLSTLTVRGLRRPDVVVGVTPSLSGAVLARLIGRRFRVPYGIVVQDLVGPGALQSGMSGGQRVAGMVRSSERWALSVAERVAIVSKGFGSYLRDLGVPEDRIVHIPNWSNIPRSEADPAEVRRMFGLPQDALVVLHAGAMGLKQGLEQVVDAARLDAERGGSLTFVLSGDGSRRKWLERLAHGSNNVVFLPQQPPDRYADLLVAADVLLVSERSRMVDMSLPGKLTSYLAAGRPVVAAVASDGATAAEVRRSGAGVVTPAADPDRLLVALRSLAEDPDRSAELGAKGRSYAERCLEREQQLAAYRTFVAGLRRDR